MSATQAQSRSFVIAGFTAEVTLPPSKRGAVSSMSIEWSPSVPDFDRDFSPAEQAEYQRKLFIAISEVGL